jgi:hypothetical protein
MDEFAELAAAEREARRIARRQWFWLHLTVYMTAQVFLLVVFALDDTSYPWVIFPFFGWGIFLVAHGIYAFVVKSPEEIMIERARRSAGEQP